MPETTAWARCHAASRGGAAKPVSVSVMLVPPAGAAIAIMALPVVVAGPTALAATRPVLDMPLIPLRPSDCCGNEMQRTGPGVRRGLRACLMPSSILHIIG